MPEIIFDGNFPSSAETELKDLLDKTCWLLPGWVQRLRIGWNREEGVIATMRTEKEYRYCRLTIHPEFIEYGREYQMQVLYHEILHTFNTPALDTAKEYIETLCDELKNEMLKDVMIQAVNDKMEASTEDFAYTILNKFKEMQNENC